MCLVHEKLICDCDQELQVTKNTVHEEHAGYQAQNTELQPSVTRPEITHHSFVLKQQGKIHPLFFSNLELFEQISEIGPR